MGRLKGTCTGLEWFIYIILYGNNAEMGFKGNLSPHILSLWCYYVCMADTIKYGIR